MQETLGKANIKGKRKPRESKRKTVHFLRDILGDPPEGNESYGHISDSSADDEEYLPDSEIHKRRSQVERLLFPKIGESSSNVFPRNTLLYVPRHSDEINTSTADDLLPSETLVPASPSGGDMRGKHISTANAIDDEKEKVRAHANSFPKPTRIIADKTLGDHILDLIQTFNFFIVYTKKAHKQMKKHQLA
ncbi:hypothetical protein RRG08_019559 [Elysia crispata]|uniref:Uncharacterized protein n=1 Tax=Elysia crispata TaxID=231223 RepID=A0AAE0Z0U7_9GAST|nr:hypothetical protein RRG08_019559 [Elysia crispata]